MEKIPQQESSDIIKVVLFGPESTGKTTLSRQLSKHYNTQWVPEFAREYLQKKWNTENKTCEINDILPIAIGQMKLENNLSPKANKILFCDTDILETKAYSEIFYGITPNKLDLAILQNQHDLYLLTYIDTPWVADDLRDRPNEREEMFNYFKQTLISHNKKYITLKGDLKTRLKTAIKAIDELIKNESNTPIKRTRI